MTIDRHNAVSTLLDVIKLAKIVGNYLESAELALEDLESADASEADKLAAEVWAAAVADPIRACVSDMIDLLGTLPTDDHTPPPADSSPDLKSYIARFIDLKKVPLSGKDEDAIALWMFENGYQA